MLLLYWRDRQAVYFVCVYKTSESIRTKTPASWGVDDPRVAMAMILAPRLRRMGASQRNITFIAHDVLFPVCRDRIRRSANDESQE